MVRAIVVAAGAAIGLTALTMACVGDEPFGSDAGSGDGGPSSVAEAGPGSFAVTLEPASVVLRVGAPAKIAVRLERGAWSGVVTLKADTQIEGVTFVAPDVEGGKSAGEITLTAQPSAALGAVRLPLTVEAADRSFKRTTILAIDIRGASGSLDKSFGVGGISRGLFPGKTSGARAVALDAEDRILVGGYTRAGSEPSLPLVARLTDKGAIDTVYPGMVAATSAGSGEVHALFVDASGRVVAAGSSWTGGKPVAGVFRLSTAGAPDPSFGSGLGGVRVLTEVGGAGFSSSTLLAAVPVGTDVIVGGSAVPAGVIESRWVLARLDPTGANVSPPKTMSDGDISLAIQSLAIAADRLFASGSNTGLTSALDLAAPELSAPLINAQRLLPVPGGKLVVADSRRVKRVKLGPPLELDGENRDVGMGNIALALQADDKLVLAGTEGSQVSLQRRNPEGNLDPTFNETGTVPIPLPGLASPRVQGMAITKSGNKVIFVGGSLDDAVSDLFVARAWL